MKQTPASYRHVLPSALLLALVGVTLAGVALADLMATNAAGVRAGITGIITVPPNTINVQYAVLAPTGTNVTTFVIQRSPNLAAWSNFTPTVTVTGSIMGAVGDFTTPTSQFYRMHLINFR
jgi:hypothetical protein